MPPSFVLYGAPGCGSMIVEAAFGAAGLAPQFVDLDWESLGPQRGDPRLLALNPLGQVPTLLLPDGRIMTESAAMILHLADLRPEAGLLPPPGHPQRPACLRWLQFLVAAVYPTFTYGDEPLRWVEGDEAAAERLKRGVENHREALWRYLEGQVGDPWFLGETWSALDLYLWGMTYWRPGRGWFAEHCPRLHAIATSLDDHPLCRPVLERSPFEA